MNKISIIVRTKNEERWIGHCLKAIYKQNFPSFEVILVDNNSTDSTLEIAKRFPIKRFLNIEKFLPGKAINLGIKASSGNLICCISAHCVPKNNNWLTILSKNIIEKPKIGGVYGRQIPTSFTEAIDKRDLVIVFGKDKRIQKKDYFFHNANSMFRRDIWERFNFDEEVTNIEDRVWGKKLVEEGLSIVYEPEAEVFHHHGLHQGNNPKRAKGVVSIIEKIENEFINDLPKTMMPENSNIIAIVPVAKKLDSNSRQRVLFNETIKYLLSSKYLKSIYILSNEKSLCPENTFWLNRKKIKNSENLNLDQLLKISLLLIEEKSIFPDSLIYFNYDYIYRPEGLIDNLIIKFLYGGYDTTFSGLIDYSHYWFKNKEGEFFQTDDSFNKREKRDPIFKALYGLGCIAGAHNIKKGKMVTGKIGILPLEEEKFTKRFFH
tara:strand:+ start:233 stop:1534 length:1302 start_codon:yes stop_codon:yes gene_type:complete